MGLKWGEVYKTFCDLRGGSMKNNMIYCGVPCSPCLGKTGLMLARIFLFSSCLSIGDTWPRWHATI